MRLSLPLRRPARWGAGVAAVVAVALAALPAAARADVILNETLPFAGTVFNHCNSQDVIFDDGHQHTVMSATASGGGTFTLTTQINIQATGFDALMRKYQLSDTSSDVQKFSLQAGEVATAIFDHTLVGPERGDNAHVRARFHLTVNANGVPTASFDRLETYCR